MESEAKSPDVPFSPDQHTITQRYSLYNKTEMQQRETDGAFD